MKNIIVTGASGFVGTYFLSHGTGLNLRIADLLNTAPSDIDFSGIDSVLHLAGLAHQKTRIPDEEYFRVNSALAVEVAKLAKLAGVKQFVYMSSVKVYGEYSQKGIPFTENSACNPNDGYSRSKLDAEERLRNMEDDYFKVALIRSSMVYGPGVKANMLGLIRLISRFKVLPLGNIANKRSMIYLGNLSELIRAVIKAEMGGVFLASDLHPVSTTQLVTEISACLGRDLMLIRLPLFMQRLLMMVIPSVAGRLFGSFELDCSKTNRQLSYKPPYAFHEGISDTVRWYTEFAGK